MNSLPILRLFPARAFIAASSLVFSAAGFTAELPLAPSLSSGSAGPYTTSQWKKDWPGCEFEGGVKEGRLELRDADNERWLRVNFAKGEIGPEAGGAGWRWPIGTHAEAELTYIVRFSPDFDFVKGGKLPGLCGGPENVSGGHRANGKNGFSARLMWRRDGRGEAYIYHMGQPDAYGESFPFPDDFRFPRGAPIRVRIRVRMNEPGQANGALRVWIATGANGAERLMVEKADMAWRGVDSFGVDGLYFEAFFGGGDKSWAPTRESWAEFTAIKVAK